MGPGSLFVAVSGRQADGHQFIVVNFPDLELRAWARFQLLQFHGKPFPVRDWLLTGVDVFQAAARELRVAFEMAVPPRGSRTDRISNDLDKLTEDARGAGASEQEIWDAITESPMRPC